MDSGAAVNIMPYSLCRKIGWSAEDLISTNIVLNDFNDNPSPARGVLNVELTIGKKTITTAFFIVDSQGPYSALLGRDWIHANCCMPSSMHQCLIQWDGDEVEVVAADDTCDVATVDAPFWQAEQAECLTGQDLQRCDFVEASKNGLRPVLATGLEEQE